MAQFVRELISNLVVTNQSAGLVAFLSVASSLVIVKFKISQIHS